MSRNSRRRSRERSKLKRASKNISDTLTKQAAARHAEMLKRLANPTTGEKPADPEPPTPSAPNDGVDEWRNEKRGR